MISNSLLSEILEVRVKAIDTVESDRTVKENMVAYLAHDNNDVPYEDSINLYELAFLCKEWVYKNSWKEIASYQLQDANQEYRVIVGTDLKFSAKDKQGFYADTEVKAIIKATEWVYKQSEKERK